MWFFFVKILITLNPDNIEIPKNKYLFSYCFVLIILFSFSSFSFSFFHLGKDSYSSGLLSMITNTLSLGGFPFCYYRVCVFEPFCFFNLVLPHDGSRNDYLVFSLPPSSLLAYLLCLKDHIEIVILENFYHFNSFISNRY